MQSRGPKQTLGEVHSPSGRQTWGQMELNLLLHNGKEGVLHNKAPCELLSDHQPQERAAFLPSARFHLVLLQRPCGCQVPSALRTLLKGHSWAFLFTCLSRMWWVSRTSLLGSPCPTFAPTEFKLVVKYFPLPLSGKRLAVTQFPVWEMGIESTLLVWRENSL